MSDKTCGTCVNYVPFPLRRGEGLCFMTIDDDFPMFMRSDNACDGGVYSERPDSLEQWARDMLIFLDNDEGAFCEHCVGNGEGCCGEYLCATMAEARNNFLVRLKALGVKP